MKPKCPKTVSILPKTMAEMGVKSRGLVARPPKMMAKSSKNMARTSENNAEFFRMM